MPTYWDAFLNDYGQELHDLTMRQILEKFWRYCQRVNEIPAEIIDEEI